MDLAHLDSSKEEKKRQITHHTLYFAPQLYAALFCIYASPFHPFFSFTLHI